MGKKHCTVGFIAAGQAFADGYHGTVHPFTYDFNYCTMPGQWCQHNMKCCTKRDFLYFCVNFWAICQNSVQASFLPAEHILQTFYFCYCHSRFAFISLKQNSGPSLVGKAAVSDNPLSCVLFHLRGAISSFCAAYRITFYLRQSAGRYNRSVLLLRQPTLYHPC